jgi:hypothetical protein
MSLIVFGFRVIEAHTGQLHAVPKPFVQNALPDKQVDTKAVVHPDLSEHLYNIVALAGQFLHPVCMTDGVAYLKIPDKSFA